MKQAKQFKMEVWFIPDLFVIPKILWILGMVVLSLNMYGNPKAHQSSDIKLTKQILLFEKNKGQFEKSILFKALDKQAHYEFLKNSIDVSLVDKLNKVEFAYKMKFISANENVKLKGNKNTVNPQFGARNYITKDGMISDVGYFKEIKYESLWNNIDALFHNSGEGMKYDFIVSPGGEPKDIKIALDGVKNLAVNKKGELSFVSSLGKLLKGAPHTYQIINGKKIIVASAYIIEKEILSFEIGDYNTEFPLIIDPIALKYATVLGNGEHSYRITTSILNKAGDKLYYIASKDSLVNGKADDVINIGCMNANGSAVLWTTTIYGIGDKTDPAEYHEGLSINVNDAGDVFASFYNEYPGTIGLNKIAQILGPHPAYPAKAGLGDPTNDATYQLIRLSPDGATLKYFTFLGGTDEIYVYPDSKFVVKGDKVYIGINLYDFSDKYLSVIPPTTGAINTITNLSGSSDYGAAIVCYNTAVSGASSIEKAAYLGDIEITQIIEDKQGDFYISGYGYRNISNAYQPEWSINPISAIEDVEDRETYPVIIKTDASLSTILYSSPVTVILPGEDPELYFNDVSIDLDNVGNLFLSYSQVYYNSNTFRRTIDINTITTPALKTNVIQSYPNLNTILSVGIVFKIPTNNLSKPAWSSIIPLGSDYSAGNRMGVDGKGRTHLLLSSSYNPIATNGAIQDFNGIPGKFVQYLTLSQTGNVAYGAVLGSSYEESISVGSANYTTEDGVGSLSIDKLRNTIYTFSNYEISQTKIVTPSYWDYQTMSQVNVAGTDNGKKLTLKKQSSLLVFNEANYTNTITDFPGGANTFCVGGQIYQDPNSGPINGIEPQFISGNGSLATHNIPDLYRAGIRFPHPIPKSPKIAFQWQRSEDGGTTWGNIDGENKAVLKPEPYGSAGTIQFRRLGISGDTIISNTATAIIAGTFNLQINGPTDPTYYCAGLPSQSLGVTVTGASGNITWQWYDGFTPVGNTIISPASGSGAQGTFSASVGSAVTKSGFYRLVVIDAGGCRKEYFASIQPLTAKAFATITAAVCPGGTGSIRLGPISVNPLFDYRWAGPSSFTSSLPNPVSSTGGKYYLEVKLKTQSSFCAGGKDSVDVVAFTAHDVALVNTLTEKGYCQSDGIDSIGLNNPAPASGYNYSWAPSSSLSSNNTFRTTFNPQLPPFKVAPLDSLFYVFNATRISDGCIFSDTLLVRDTILAVADASLVDRNIEIVSGCSDGSYLLRGGPKMEATYFEWEPKSTTFPGGLAALMGSASFGVDKLGSSKGAKKQALIYYPQGNYEITFTLKAAYFPIGSTRCIHVDSMKLIIACGSGGFAPCTVIGADNKGINGACSQKGVVITAPSATIGTWNSVVWTTKKVNNVLQPANTVPKGLYTESGASLASITGNHPEKVTVNIEDGTWGWSTADSVIYQFTATSVIAGFTTTCTQEIKIFSGSAFAPPAKLKDTLACFFPTVANGTMKYNANGKAELPLSLTNANYSVAPSGGTEYNWERLFGGGTITGASNNRFPTLSPTTSAEYKLTMRDSSTGCITLDTLSLNVVKVEARAGANQITGCQGSIVKLGTDSLSNHTYKWTPSAGLFYPITGSSNDSVAEPFTIVPSGTTTFNLITTEITSGCQATDLVVITSNAGAPAPLTNATILSCKDKKIGIGPGASYVAPSGATIVWTATGGSANLSWLSSTTVLNPEVQMPAVFSTQAIFTLTITKGSCGTTSATYTIDPVGAISAGVDVITSCTPTLVKIGASSNNTAYNYKWFPQQGLFTDNLGATKFNNLVDNLFEVYARPSEDTDYTLLATHKASGCIVTDIVKVSTPAGLSLSLNDDITYCPGSGNAPLIGTGTGSNPTWTVVSGGVAALGYLSSTSAMTVNFSQTIPVPGVYVYRLTLNGTGGCTISDDIKVTVYEFSTGLAGGDVDVCEGTPTQLGTKNIPSAYNFNWSVVSPLFSANSIGNKTDKNPTVLPLVKTIYEVTYSDAVSGCATTERVIVTPIPKLTINTLATSITCGEIVGLNVTSLVQRLDTVQNPTWYKDFIPSLQVSSPSSFSTNKNTTFYVVGQNQFGCVDTGRIVLDVEPVRKPVIVDTVVLVPNVSTINLNDYLPLSSSVSTGTLAWYTSSTGASGTQVTSPLQSAGTYYCIEKTAAGCVSPAARLSVVPPNPILRAEFSCNTTCSNFDVGLDFIIKNNDFLNVSTGLAFTVNLPAGLTVGTNVSSSTCGGIITAVAGASAITFTGGSAGAGAECIVSIPISGVVGGPYSVSSANVTPGAGLDNGITVAQTVTVTASCAGQGPGKPLNLVVNQDGNMSWSAPQNLGSGSVVDYLIEYSTNGGTSWQTFNDGISNAAATYFNIVDPTLTYQFRITAINSFGSGCSALLSPTYSNLSNCSGPFACAGNINVLLSGDCSKTVSVQELLLPCGPIGYTVKVNDINPTNGGIVDGISPVGGWLYGIFDQNGALVCQGRIVSTDGSGPVMSPNQLSAWNAIDTIVTWADNVDEIYNVPSSWWGNNVGYSSIPVFGSKYYTGRPYMVDSCELVGGVNPSSDTWIIDADDDGLESMNDKWDIHRSRNLQVRVTDYLESPQGTGNGYHHLLRRTFQFTDQRGNSAFLNQIIYFQRPAARGSFANRFDGIATPGANPQTPLDRGPGNLGQFGPFGSGPRKAHSSYGEADNKDLNKANMAAFSYATTLGADQMTTPYGMGGQMLRDTIVYDISNGNCYNFNAASEMKKLLTGIYVAVDTLPSGAKDSVSLFSDQLNSQFSASFSYKEFPACNNGKNYEVVTTVFDWNTGAQSFDTLIIQMLDKSAPVFAAERAALPILGSSSTNPILVSVGTNDCTGSLRLGNAANLRDLSTLFNLKVTDNCSALTAINLNYAFETKDYWNQLYYVPQGSYTAATYTVVNTGNVPTVIGLPIGQHKVTITANDGCNNQSTQVLYFDVIDNVAPVMKCDDALTVSLTSNSSSNYYIDANKSDADLAKQMQARLYVADINEGSRDNCTLDSLYVRRQFHKDCLPYFALNMEYDIYGNTPNGKVELNDFDRVGTTDLYYTPKFMQYVDFFCCDPSTVMVELWGSDARHYNNVSAGNWNYCWTNVTIEDKTAPVTTAPVLTKTYNSSNQYKGVSRPVTNWVNCTDKEVIGTSSNTDGDIANEAASNLLFGYPDIYGLECKGSVAYSVTKKLTCDTGTITRRWVVTKEIGDGKIITVRDSQLIHVRANHNFSITVPVDQSATCSVKNGTDLILDEVGCDLLAVSYSETKYDAAPGDNFCYKIYRTATVINWCMLPNHFSCAAADPGAYAVTIPRNTGTAAVKYTFTLGSANTGRSQTALEASTAGSSVLVKGGAIAAAGESLVQGTTTASGFISPATTNCFNKPGFAYKYTQIIKVTDEVKPTVASGTAWTPATAAADVAAGINWNATKNSFSIAGKSNAANSCLAKIKLSFAASDACATNDLELENTELFKRGTNNAGTGTFVTKTAAATTNGLFTVELSGVPVGEYDLRVTVRDDCGNVTVSRLAVDVEDNKAPAPVCVQNLTATLMPNGTGGCMVVVAAKDVFQDINRDWTLEECTPGAVKAEIVKLTNGVEGAKAATLTLTSADKGIVTARIYLTDAAGNADFCTVTINVEDNFCGNGTASAAVTGAIQTESKVTVEGVQVNLSGQTQKSFATGVNGLFVFNNLTAGADYTVTPSLNKGFLNGVSTYDLILISKHILGVQPLNTSYKLIAADVNNSKSVTTLDLIQLRKLILNIDATFANNSSWRFVDASYTFPNASNPWAASFPEVKNVNDLVGSLSANFVAVKVGDVNGNAIANSTQGSVRHLTSNLGINVADMNMVAGNEYKVDFTAADLNGIEGFQFSLNLDKKGLELVDLVPGIAAEENFGIFTQEGVITASWNGEAKGGVLFSLVVRAKSNTTLSEVLNLNSRYTAAEAYKGREVMNVGLNFNASKASANYELYQNTPNPFAGQTIIGFNLPAAGAATLTIQDLTGRTLKVINGQYAKGYNQVTVNDRDLSTKGVLTYTLKVADFTMTKKMVIVE